MYVLQLSQHPLYYKQKNLIDVYLGVTANVFTYNICVLLRDNYYLFLGY